MHFFPSHWPSVVVVLWHGTLTIPATSDHCIKYTELWLYRKEELERQLPRMTAGRGKKLKLRVHTNAALMHRHTHVAKTQLFFIFPHSYSIDCLYSHRTHNFAYSLRFHFQHHFFPTAIALSTCGIIIFLLRVNVLLHSFRVLFCSLSIQFPMCSDCSAKRRIVILCANLDPVCIRRCRHCYINPISIRRNIFI